MKRINHHLSDQQVAKLKKESKGDAPPEFLSTHPDMDNRIKNIQQKVKIYKKQKFSTEPSDSIFKLIKKI